MFMPGELMIPVAAGPVRGPRHARLIDRKLQTSTVRTFPSAARHRLDVRATGTNNDGAEASAMVINIYARTRLQVELAPEREVVDRADGFRVAIAANALAGQVLDAQSFGRLIGPSVDAADVVRRVKPKDIPRRATYRGPEDERSHRRIDNAILLGILEQKRPKLADVIDEEVPVAQHGDGPAHFHVEERKAPGGYHLGVYLEGTYCPAHDAVVGEDNHDHDHAGGEPHDHAEGDHDDHGHGDHHDHDHGDAGHGDDCPLETFTRYLSASVAAVRADRSR
jgi:hypothetical protein